MDKEKLENLVCECIINVLEAEGYTRKDACTVINWNFTEHIHPITEKISSEFEDKLSKTVNDLEEEICCLETDVDSLERTNDILSDILSKNNIDYWYK